MNKMIYNCIWNLNIKEGMGFSFSGRENSKERGEAAIQRAWKVIN